MFKGLTPHQLHYDVRNVRFRFLAHIEDGYDSRMRQAPCSLRFPEETLAILAFLMRRLAGHGNGFHCDHAVDLWIVRLVDNTHGSPSQLAQDLVSSKTFGAGIVHS